MATVKRHKSGFRTFEMDTFHHQSEFFRRFIFGYPQALDELKDLLPLFQHIFGPPIIFDITEFPHRHKTYDFDGKFLIPQDRILSEVNERGFDYDAGLYRFKHSIPSFISLPAEHAYKCNEEYYKSVVHNCLLYGIASLQEEAGDSSLLDSLNSKRKFAKDKEAEFKEIARRVCSEQQIAASESEIFSAANRCTDEFLEKINFYDDDEADKLLITFWEFYQKFDGWLAKYGLHRAWLRRSFFIALRRGLSSHWPDIGEPINLPKELQAEFYGEPLWASNNLPDPEPFRFRLSRYTKGTPGLVTVENEWRAETYALFDTPPKYLADVVDKFKQALEKTPFFDLEKSLKQLFSSFLDDAIQDTNEEQRAKTEAAFAEHVRQFALFDKLRTERSALINPFEQHIQSYLDGILPVVAKHLRTNEGAPPKYDRINWLLDWNIRALTAREITEKYGLAEESTFWKAVKDLRRYNLPFKHRNRKTVDWNDDWFVKRMNDGFADWKKPKRKNPKIS